MLPNFKFMPRLGNVHVAICDTFLAREPQQVQNKIDCCNLFLAVV